MFENDYERLKYYYEKNGLRSPNCVNMSATVSSHQRNTN